MYYQYRHRIGLIAMLLLGLCAHRLLANPLWPGGQGSTSVDGRSAFSQPSALLDLQGRMQFSVGNSFFRSPWVQAPSSTTARDGLGPLFNANSCQGCHIKDGRGHPPYSLGDNALSSLVRISIPPTDQADQAQQLQQWGAIAEPSYGLQIQDRAVAPILAEARVRIDYKYTHITLADGERVELRQPRVTLDRLMYGPLHPQAQLSLRVAPTMIGLGLLEAIALDDLQQQVDEQDSNQDGISGRLNWVWDWQQQQTRPGRFGWKAGQPSLAQQNAAAFQGDLGLSSALLPQSNCTAQQSDCAGAPQGSEPEVSAEIFDAVLFYSRHLAVPQRRQLSAPQVQQGEKLFHQAGCAQCHTPQFTTLATATQPAQTIYPYSDLLLHDMGPGLADQRGEFLATGQEWRTPPLWGLGYTQEVSGHSFLLHDGRARSLLEAVLWHGGEAQAAADQVMRWSAAQRQQLLAFLRSL